MGSPSATEKDVAKTKKREVEDEESVEPAIVRPRLENLELKGVAFDVCELFSLFPGLAWWQQSLA